MDLTFNAMDPSLHLPRRRGCISIPVTLSVSLSLVAATKKATGWHDPQIKFGCAQRASTTRFPTRSAVLGLRFRHEVWRGTAWQARHAVLA